MKLTPRFALVTAVAALAAGSTPAAVGDLPPAPRAVLAISAGANTPLRLVRLDALTLRRLPGRSVGLGRSASGWVLSPDARHLAVGGGGVDGLRIVDVRRMRTLGALRSGSAFKTIEPLAWLGQSTLFGVQHEHGRTAELLEIDVTRRRTVARRALPGPIWTLAVSPRNLALLLTTPGQIGPAQLLVAGVEGETRIVTLGEISIGAVVENEEPHRARAVTPALAVDPDGERAFVIAADRALVAEVDLATLAVEYHELRERQSFLGRLRAWLEPSAQAKVSSGPVRHARWLGDGLIAVSGADYHVSLEAGRTTMTTIPAGVRLIDTRSWTIWSIDSRATAIAGEGELLLAFGAVRDPLTETEHGMGLAVYGPDGERRFHAFENEAIWWVQTAGRFAYLLESGSGPQRRVRVLDLGSGQVLRELRRRLPAIVAPLP